MKHGIENHFVRPDRVYATSVWSPVVGYQPAEDAYQVGARFVAGGQGLAGLGFRGRLFSRFRKNGRGSVRLQGPGQTFMSWLRIKFAGLRARIDAMRIRRQLVLPPGVPTQVDASPRPPAPYSGAIPTSAGYAPAPQSPTSIAQRIRAFARMQSDTPALPAPMAAQQVVPAVSNLPDGYWAGISQGLPPLVAQRSEHDALRLFWANRFPGAGY